LTPNLEINTNITNWSGDLECGPTYGGEPVRRDDQFALVTSNAELSVGIILTTLNVHNMHRYTISDVQNNEF